MSVSILDTSVTECYRSTLFYLSDFYFFTFCNQRFRAHHFFTFFLTIHYYFHFEQNYLHDVIIWCVTLLVSTSHDSFNDGAFKYNYMLILPLHCVSTRMFLFAELPKTIRVFTGSLLRPDFEHNPASCSVTYSAALLANGRVVMKVVLRKTGANE